MEWAPRSSSDRQNAPDPGHRVCRGMRPVRPHSGRCSFRKLPQWHEGPPFLCGLLNLELHGGPKVHLALQNFNQIGTVPENDVTACPPGLAFAVSTPKP